MRAFNQLVMDTTITGTTAVCTPNEYDELLGRADELSLEVELEATAGTTPVLTLDVYFSNSGKGWVAAPSGTLLAAVSLASLPYRNVVPYNASTISGLVQLRVILGGTTPAARVRIWACGRTR